MMPRIGAMLLLCLLAIGAGCSREQRQTAPSQRLQVVTTIFPLYDFCRNVGGERVEVTLLLPPGVEPHSFEPKPEDVLRINRSALFIYTNRYLEPWAADILKGAGSGGALPVDASAGVDFLKEGGEEQGTHAAGDRHHNHGGFDPHIWLSPANARIMVENIRAALAKRSPADQAYFDKNAAAYQAKLDILDRQFRDGLADCRKRLFLHGGHYAFGYLAQRYGLHYLSAYSLSPNAEPTPGRMAELIRLLKSNDLHFVFYEELFSPKVADTLARETGTTLLKLHGVHNLSREELAGGATYLSLMEQNLGNLKTGLEFR